MAALADLPIIDVDTHYTEPADFWTRQAPASLRQHAPRIVADARGKPRWVVGDDLVLGPPGFCVIRRDGSKERGIWTLADFEEMTPAASEPAARLAVMDDLGLHAQILYPNVLGFAGSYIMRVDDVSLRNFCITAYNDGMAEVQSAGEGRLHPQFLLPFWDRDAAVAELIRCHETHGMKGVCMTDAPELFGLPTLAEAHWDPLWAEAESRGLPINFHIGSGGFGGGAWNTGDTRRTLAAMSTMAQLNNMRCIVNLIFSGVLDRFPELAFVSVESGLGWIPFLLEAASYQSRENAVGLALTPREYFERQIYVSYWFERDNVADAIAYLGTANVMFETDFPHPTCLYPGVAEQVQASLGGFDESVQRRILYQNAARLYQLPEPPAPD